MRDIRVVALDLDGTLLTSQGVLPPEGRALLMQAAAAGVHVILLTTRRYESVVNFQRQLQLQNGSCI